MAGPGITVVHYGAMTMIDLPDGRRLEVEVSGPPDGPALLLHHGTPGSAVQLRGMQAVVHARGLRLVTYSRAGYGTSTRRPDRTVSDVTDDVSAVLDAIEAPRALVAGWSGGGPHALACGALLADRVAGVLVMAGVAPYAAAGLDWMSGMGQDNVEEFGFALEGEPALRRHLEGLRETHFEKLTGDTVIASMATLLPEVDRAVLTDEFADDLAASIRAGVGKQVDGWVDDDLAFTRTWGFELSAVTVPTFLWQGTEDLMVPFDHGRWLADHLPGATVHLEEGEGHLSITIGAFDRMLDEMVDNAG